MLFNEPKLLKYQQRQRLASRVARFSALQRAEIAEIRSALAVQPRGESFSALQRAEIAEISSSFFASSGVGACFSALQRAEIAEIPQRAR